MAGVLIIADSLTVRMDLKQALDAAGHATTVSASIAAAHQELAGGSFGLIILDLLLPDGDGLELLREIRSNPRTVRTPVMLLSTEAEVHTRLGDLSCGAVDYVGKPYDRSYVITRAGQLLHQRDEPPPPGSRLASDEQGRGQGRPIRILAVDDSPTYLHGLAEQLRGEGMEVLLARSGEEALHCMTEQPVDVVLLDLVMEGMSGQETCRRIRSVPAWHDTPVLMLTAMEEREAMAASFDAGADDFVSKSSEFAVLRARLQAQVRRRQLEEEHRRMLEQLHQREVEAAQACAQRDLAEARALLLADLERKNAEAEEANRAMRSLYAQLDERARQLEHAKNVAEIASHAKDHFLAVLSHELRTPLTPVVATVALLQSTPGLSEDVQQNLEVIARNAKLEARLIDDLLDMTRIARGKVELDKHPVPLCEVINRAVEVCKPDIEARRLEFGVNIGDAAPYIIHADVTRLQQVFWNLLKNAIKFTPHGGCVGIRCWREGDMVIAEVNDSGEGIDPGALTRIFDAFEQAERSITRQFGGLGLGLAISKALVELHGGTITAHSKGKGRGATFTVKLPVTDIPLPAGTSPGALPSTCRDLATRSLRILLVEDHGDTARVMQRLLAASGHEVQRAGDVATALDLAGSGGFDLLISDLGLPDGSGVDLMRELRRRAISIPGIALSGYGREDDVRGSKEAGFSEHLTKPVDLERLATAIAQVGDARQNRYSDRDRQDPGQPTV